MTAVQADHVRGLGGYAAALYVSPPPPFFFFVYLFSSLIGVCGVGCFRFMAASKVLGEETVAGQGQGQGQAHGQGQGRGQEKREWEGEGEV